SSISVIVERMVSCPSGVTEISVPTANGPWISNLSLPGTLLAPMCRSRRAAQIASGATSVSSLCSNVHMMSPRSWGESLSRRTDDLRADYHVVKMLTRPPLRQTADHPAGAGDGEIADRYVVAAAEGPGRSRRGFRSCARLDSSWLRSLPSPR